MEENIRLMDLFLLGGPLMWVLAVFSLVTVAVILEKAVFFLTIDLRTSDLAAEVSAELKKGDRASAGKILERQSGKKLCAAVYRTIIDDPDSLEIAEAAISGSGIMVERHLGILSAVSSIAPVTGFLGTVTGMIRTFMDIARADDISARLAASGIFEALITTAFGLIIAVFAVVFYHIYAAMADKYIVSLENSCKIILAECHRQNI
ncbi:MAG: MotA/TolQ/ExbB proton channel family protein [Spirochaetia bacterium]|nr:MotA/TolQ/ExbB proton channel family protein [Spirochaetia bacterium]